MPSVAARGASLALLAAGLFGLVNVTAKQSTLSPFALAGATYLLAGLVLLPWLRGLRLGPGDGWRVAVMTFTGAFAAPVALYHGLNHANAADASLLLTMEMAFTALLAALVLGERVRGRARLGQALLFGSALLVAGSGLLAPRLEGATTLLGALLILGAALGWSVDNLASTHLTRRHDPRGLICLKCLLGGAACLAFLVASEPLPMPTPRHALEVGFIGLLGVAASTLLFYRALHLVGATRTTAVFVPAIALSGAAAGWALLDEPLGWPHALAVGLMVAGVALLTTAQAESPAPQPASRGEG